MNASPQHHPVAIFNQQASVQPPQVTAKAANKPAPFSLRLTAEERALLEAQAGSKPLGRYIRDTLLGEAASQRRRQRKPVRDEQQLAAVLSALGDSRLASNLNQLAHHANCGTLRVNGEIERELHDAYAAVLAMRHALLIALGMRAGATT